MCEGVGMIWKRWRTLLVVVALGAGVAVGGSVALRSGSGFSGNAHKNSKGQKRQDRAKNGRYNAMIAGNFRGTGTADVWDDSVSIDATLTDESGTSYLLTAPNLAVDGPYFSGAGRIGPNEVTVSGRVDAARASRLSAYIVFSDGRGSRVIGTLPPSVDPPDDNWRDNNDGNHNGNGEH